MLTPLKIIDNAKFSSFNIKKFMGYHYFMPAVEHNTLRFLEENIYWTIYWRTARDSFHLTKLSKLIQWKVKYIL